MGAEMSACCAHGPATPERNEVQGDGGSRSQFTAPDSPTDRGDQPSEETEAEKAKRSAAQGGKRRAGIAAESVDSDKVKNYVKPVYPKDLETKNSIRKTLTENEKMKVLFGHLEGKGLDDVIDAFMTRETRNGQDIIKQGDEGDNMYIISDGQVDVYVARPDSKGNFTPGDKGTKVVTLGQGALFGELALMYSAPRAATVVVASPTAKLWALEREAFKMLLAQSAQTQYSLYEGWLQEVDILKSLNHFELSRLAEIMEPECFEDGEVIIKQGDPGEMFYILEEGTCAAYISGQDGEKEVKRYDNQGQFFGEIALLTDAPRKATVKATSDVAVLHISKEDFTAVLGPLKDKLMGELDKYPQYADILQ